MRACLIIPAAGRSRRFGTADKLNQDLGGRPLLIRSIEPFTRREEVTAMVVAGPPDDFAQFTSRFGATLGFHGATLVPGGSRERWETVRHALDAVPDDCTHIAVHDAARPGISDELLKRLFEAARELDAVVPGVPIAGTLKRAGEGVTEIREQEDDAIADTILGDAGRVTVESRVVVETVDRRGLFEIQTPQLFAAHLLRRAYEQPDLQGATDDASLVERLGVPVHIVEGDVRNVKVTTPGDLPLMRAILGVKPPAERPVHKRF